MVAKAESIVESVRSGDHLQKLQAVRHIKNSVIGSRAKKLQYLKAGAMPHLVSIMASKTDDSGLLVQATATVGSLAYKLEDGVQAVLASGGLQQLLRQLLSNDERVVEAAVRCLHFLLQSDKVPREEVSSPATLARLVAMLASPHQWLMQPAARVLAHTCTSGEQQNTAAANGAVPALTRLLRSSDKGQQEAAVTTLAALTDGNDLVAGQLAKADGAVPALLALLRDREPSIRQLACRCLTQLIRFGHIDAADEAAPRAVLTALVRLLAEESEYGGDDSYDAVKRVPALLADLVRAQPSLQALAADTDAVVWLAGLLMDPIEPPVPGHLEGVFRAMAVLMLEQESAREQFMASEALPAVIAALGKDQPEGVQAAAACCIKALSRSAKDLRTRLSKAPVAAPLVALLQAPQPEVQSAAAAALCNLVLDFSPIKEAVLEEGGLPQLVSAAGSMDAGLRLNGMWALQNLAHGAESQLKTQLMAALPWPTVSACLYDSDPAVKERALNLVRNLVHGAATTREVMTWAAEDGRPGSGTENLLGSLSAVLQPGSQSTAGQRMQALFALCNISAGEMEQQAAVVASGALSTLEQHFHDEADGVREAATWCVVNLVFSESQPQPLKWVEDLTRMGIPSAMAALESDPCQNVRRNVSLAMKQFSKPEAMVCDD